MIMKCKEKYPETIEAIRFWGDEESVKEAAEFTFQSESMSEDDMHKYVASKAFPVTNDFKGEHMVAVIGDYIMKRRKNYSTEFRVYSPSVFNGSYEIVE